MVYTIRQLNYFNSVYWDVVDEKGHDVGLFGNPKTAQVFADNLTREGQSHQFMIE